MIKIIFLLIGAFSLSACEHQNPKNDIDKNKEQISTVVVDSVVKNTRKTDLDYYQEAKDLTQKWNSAISNQDYNRLAKLYAPNIEMYGTEQTLEACLAAKQKWLSQHANYTQKINGEIRSSNYEFVKPKGKKFVTRFEKIAIQNGKEKKYKAILEFEIIGEQLKICKETDITTILALAKKKKGQKLHGGKFALENSRWEQPYAGSGSGHSQVRMEWSIYLEVKENVIQPKGKIQYYSGYMREVACYTVIKGEIKGDILELEAVYSDCYEEEELEQVKEKDIQKIRIKTFENEWVVLNDELISKGTILYRQ